MPDTTINFGWKLPYDPSNLPQFTQIFAAIDADASTFATEAYADSLVIGLLDDRGNYNASGNTFPASGGSGAAGAVLKGDLWTISVAGTLGGHPVTVGDVVRALVDTPGQTDANWAISENNFGYVALNQALADGKIYVGNGSGIGTAVTPSGDVTMNNAGVTAIAAGVIVNADVNASAAIALTKLAAMTASRVAVSDGSGFLVPAATTATEIGYVNGVTSAIQPQLNGKASLALDNLASVAINASLIPATTDTIDLGSSTKLWRKGWLSELDAVLFAQNTISVVGGWMMIAKGEGAIPVGQDIAAINTTIDFGQVMTANDFVIFRAAGAVEYVQVLTLSSGTRYNVTRNLDGSGANAWPAGSVYVILGNTTSGRIELNANSTPRISMIKQGATYNAQTELLRIGDLNGGWGYVAETYGVALGQYASGKSSLAVDDANGIRIFNNTTVIGQWDASGVVTVGEVAAGKSNTLISAGALSIRLNTTPLFNVDASGNVRVGTNTAAAASTNLFISNALQTYNSEVGYVAGDVLIGDNTGASNFGNIKITAGAVKIRRGVTDYVTIDATEAQFTNLIKMKGASAAISIGTTPPTSASAGTGVWLDRTGLFGLAAGVQQARFDAVTGRIHAGQDDVVSIGRDGIQIKADSSYTGNPIQWLNGSSQTIGYVQGYVTAGPTTAVVDIASSLPSGSSTGKSELTITALNASATGTMPSIRFNSYSSSHATFPNVKSILITSPLLTATGDLTVSGLLKAGTTPVTLTDAAGKIVAGALDTAGTPQFARLGLGAAADATAKLTTGNIRIYESTPPNADASTNRGIILNSTVPSGIFTESAVTDGEVVSYAVNVPQVGTRDTARVGGILRLDTRSAEQRLVVYGYATGGSTASQKFSVSLQSGGVVVGSPTGGDKGAGTLNASAVYDDNVLLTDWVFDLHYDGKVKEDDKHYRGQQLFNLEATRKSAQKDRRLPWMPSRDEFEKERSLGGMVSRLWQGQEQQQLYILGLEERIRQLEKKH